MKLTIDNHELECDEDISLLEAARRVGVEIPTLCFREGYDHFTSCMVCMVKDNKTGRTLPACSARAAEGMEIETQSDEVRAFRKATLELLLSEHVGDCEAPCQRLCALHAEIPQIIRDLKAGQLEAAIASLRRDMALPGVLERLCSAPCEKGCRRGQVDESVSIQELMRHVADWDLKRDQPYVPGCPSPSGKRVAIVGAGATGLATAYYLALHGHGAVVFEQQPAVLVRLRGERLPDWVIEGELRVLAAMGVEVRTGIEIGKAVSMEQLRKEFSAVVLACGSAAVATLSSMGIPATPKGLAVDAKTAMTGIEGVFAGGTVLKKDLPILKSIQQAKAMAAGIRQLLDAKAITGLVEQYNHTMGRLQAEELKVFASHALEIPRVKPADGEAAGFADAEALAESGRCLHCDCRANHDCKLRNYSDEYGASQSGFKGEERAPFAQVNRDSGVIYEPGKCVKCGLCVRITKREGERFGFTFVGRGFEVRAAVSLHKSLEEGLQKTAAQVVEACPTGALASSDE